jgi:hypothetical protein
MTTVFTERWPSLEEAKEFEKTLKIPLLVQSEIED